MMNYKTKKQPKIKYFFLIWLLCTMTKSDSHPDPKSFLGVGSCKRIQIQTDPNSQVAKLCDRFHTKNNFYPTFYIYCI